MNRFEGRRVLLTGAASGLGRAAALRLLCEGARLFAVDRDDAGLAATAAAASGPGTIVTHVADVGDEQSVVDATAAALSALGGVDVLINVAGIQRTTPLQTLTVDDMLSQFRVNALGSLLFCREIAPHLPDGSGVIVNIASTAATHGHPFMTAYSASKGAVLAMTYSLAAELAPRRIRVVAVSPGGVQTPLTAAVRFPEGADASYYGRVLPLMGFGQPEDIAGVIAFAASSDGRYWTGSELRVDGGSHI